MIEYTDPQHATTGDTRKLGADPLDAWHMIPAELPFATRLRIERRAWQLLAAPTVRAWRIAICGVALAIGGLLTLGGALLTLGGALNDAPLLFGLAAAAHLVALVGWAAWFQRWQ